MRTTLIKDYAFGDTQGIWLRKNDKYFPVTVKCWDKLLHSMRLRRIGANRWEYKAIEFTNC